MSDERPERDDSRERGESGTPDDYDSHSEIVEKEWSAGRPPLGHDAPHVEPPPVEDEPYVEDFQDEPEDDDDESSVED